MCIYFPPPHRSSFFLRGMRTTRKGMQGTETASNVPNHTLLLHKHKRKHNRADVPRKRQAWKTFFEHGSPATLVCMHAVCMRREQGVHAVFTRAWDAGVRVR